MVKYLASLEANVHCNFPRYGPILAAKSQILEGDIDGVAREILRASDLLAEVFARLVTQPDFNLTR